MKAVYHSHSFGAISHPDIEDTFLLERHGIFLDEVFLRNPKEVAAFIEMLQLAKQKMEGN